MSSIVPFFLVFSSLTLLSIAAAQERAPHGLARENPMAFSPTAYAFFHPNAKHPVAKTRVLLPIAHPCRLLPMSKQLKVMRADFLDHRMGRRVGAGGIVGIVFGLGFVVFLAMGVYYVIVTRKTRMTRANTLKPDV